MPFFFIVIQSLKKIKFNIHETTAKTTLYISAGIKPLTIILSGTKSSHSNTIDAFITIENNPNVSKFTGKVSNLTTGFTNVFNKPNTAEAINAPLKPITSIPGTK